MDDVHSLIALFNSLFKPTYNTILVKGDNEPIYLVESKNRKENQIVFANGFFASALHEIAHWCVAGVERRKLEDFGYWYKSDGRTLEEQLEFEQVEIKPQALEWCFSVASGIKFNFSADNLELNIGASDTFKKNVKAQVAHYFKKGFPKRSGVFIHALTEFYNTKKSFDKFRLEMVR